MNGSWGTGKKTIQAFREAAKLVIKAANARN